MNLADKLAQQLESNLEGDSFDTSKNDNKNKNSSTNHIIPKKQHQLVFTYEKRKGKPVTLVGRFYLEDKEKKEILKLLKKKLACGGAIKEEWIEIQGNVKDKVKDILQQDNWKFKK
ncbi:MAG: translation initiation factor SUI1 [Campylobacterota bacterium]